MIDFQGVNMNEEKVISFNWYYKTRKIIKIHADEFADQLVINKNINNVPIQ